MIDPNNPRQLDWLKSVNSELGNQITTNIALNTEIMFLRAELAAQTEARASQRQQLDDMAQTNAVLREENQTMKAARSKRG